jgi:hypothetical protein
MERVDCSDNFTRPRVLHMADEMQEDLALAQQMDIEGCEPSGAIAALDAPVL